MLQSAELPFAFPVYEQRPFLGSAQHGEFSRPHTRTRALVMLCFALEWEDSLQAAVLPTLGPFQLLEIVDQPLGKKEFVLRCDAYAMWLFWPMYSALGSVLQKEGWSHTGFMPRLGGHEWPRSPVWGVMLGEEGNRANRTRLFGSAVENHMRAALAQRRASCTQRPSERSTCQSASTIA